jgi:hypothetical protein
MWHRSDLVIELPIRKKSPEQEKPRTLDSAGLPYQPQCQPSEINQQQPENGLHAPKLLSDASIVTNFILGLGEASSV